MALGQGTAWEIRTTGADTNGGGFNVGNANFATDGAATVANTGAPVFTSASYSFIARDVGALLFIKSGTSWVPGWYAIASVAAGAATLTATVGSAQLFGGASNLNMVAGCATVASPTAATWSVDYSQQAAAGVAFTDMVVGVTTTQFTSVLNPVGVNMVGNLISVNSGATVQFVEVVSVATITATCDKSLGTAAAVGVGNLGGCLLTLSKAGSLNVAGNKIFVRSGTYTVTASQTFATASAPTNTVPYARIIGYFQTRGDISAKVGGSFNNNANRPLIQQSTNTGIQTINCSGAGYSIENMTTDGASLGGANVGIKVVASGMVVNCKCTNHTNAGISTAGVNALVEDCEASLNGMGLNLGTGPISALRNYVHNNTGNGITVTAGVVVFIADNVVVNNGAVGIQAPAGSVVISNTVYNNTTIGISATGGGVVLSIKNNLLISNGTFGIAFTGASWAARSVYDGNAYFGNGTAPRSNMDDVGVTNPIDGVANYINMLDIILTASPLNNPGAGDFTLNNVAGGGALVRSAGTPGALPGLTQVGAPAMGAFQAAASGGTGSGGAGGNVLNQNVRYVV